MSSSINYRKTLVLSALGLLVLASLIFLPETFAHRHASDIQTVKTAKSSSKNESNNLFLSRNLTGLNSQKKTFVSAANGRAFILKPNLNGIQKIELKTSQPVFRAFGLTSDSRNLLYTGLKKGAPSGELFLEDLKSGKRRKITTKLVLNAALSPVDDRRIAYVYAVGDSFQLAQIRLNSGETETLLAENVFAEKIQWSDDGKAVHYFATDAGGTNLNLEARYVPIVPSLINYFVPSIVSPPAGFPVPEKTNFYDTEYKGLVVVSSAPEKYAFRLLVPDTFGSTEREVIGDNLLGSGNLSAFDSASKKTVALGKGQLVETMPTGVVIKTFSAKQTEIKFVDWQGKATMLASTAANYNLPLQNSTMVQGGAGYAPPGNCSLTAHAGTMDFAYDFQSQTVGAHVLASADGLVVFNTSSVTCNTIDSDSCPDYSVSGCPGSYLGNVVVIQHSDGTYTKYAHMQVNSPQVAVGTNACQGLYIGRQGHTGSTNGSFNGCGDHLHFQRQTSPDIFGQSISVDFTEAASPLSCGAGYNSVSTEVAHTIATSSQNFGTVGGNGSVTLTSTGCTWQATSNDNWITITSAASGSGNTLVTFSVANNSNGSQRTGTMNLGGHVFTVSQAGVQPPNQAPTANAGIDQTITLPAVANLSGAATDDNLPNPPANLTTTWSKVSGVGTVVFGNPNSLNTTANFSLAGIYVLRLTASDGSLTAIDELTVRVNVSGAGGVLAGSQTAPASNVNLRTEGTVDWAHWGLTAATSFNHKNGVTSQISNFSQIGSVAPLRYTNNPNSFTWTQGTPTASATNTTTGVYLYNLGSGFQITVPADTTQRNLKLYVGVWAAGGRLEAVLSDGSASPFVDTSILSANSQNGVYTLNYRAASANQTLTIKWIIESNSNQAGNITLQAATLVTVAAPTNQSPTVNAGTDQTITLPNTANLSGTAADDGLPNPPANLTTIWSKISGAGTVTFGNANSLNTTASFSTAGTYVLRLTASDGTLSVTDDAAITVNPPSSGGGMLSATSSTPPTSVNLTSEGTTDWAHWGLTAATSFNHKNGVTSQISNYAMIGSVAAQRYTNNPNSFTWTQGTPTTSTTNTATGVYVMGTNNGFQITVPADTTQKTLKLYVGLWAAGGKLEVSLSDGSASTFIDTSLVNVGDTSNRVYTLNYKAASGNQTLTAKWTVNTTFNSWSNVTLQSATLNGGVNPPTNQPPAINAGADQTITLPNSANLSGAATDDNLPNSPSNLTTTWSKVSGVGTVTFGNVSALSTTASFSTAGVYVLRLTASDSLLTSTDDLTVTVNNQPTSAGLLSVSSGNTPATVNLASIGSLDWAHWGLTAPSSFNHKNGISPLISNYGVLGSGVIQRYTNNPNLYTWSGGTPTVSAIDTATGIYVLGLNNGFQITVPANTAQRTLKLYVGLWAAGGQLDASLSDGSAANFIDTSLDNPNGTSSRVYTLDYKAASAGQTLTVKWTVNTVYNNWSNVTLQAAALF